jgi:hypothetical protein
MNDFQKLIQALRQELPRAELKIEEPERERQSGWLDIDYDGMRVVVEWRSWQGFGVSLQDTGDPLDGLFEGPDEVYETWTDAKDRILFWLRSSEAAAPRRRAALG